MAEPEKDRPSLELPKLGWRRKPRPKREPDPVPGLVVQETRPIVVEEPEPEPEPQPTSTPLEKIPGVGERIAAKLRDAGVNLDDESGAQVAG